MKEVIYRNITGANPRKREVSIEEITGRVRFRIMKKWVSKYFIKDSYMSEDPEEIKRWILSDRRNGTINRYHVLRHLDDRKGCNKLVFKAIGEFYIVCEPVVYKIFYVNMLRIQVRL